MKKNYELVVIAAIVVLAAILLFIGLSYRNILSENQSLRNALNTPVPPPPVPPPAPVIKKDRVYGSYANTLNKSMVTIEGKNLDKIQSVILIFRSLNDANVETASLDIVNQVGSLTPVGTPTDTSITYNYTHSAFSPFHAGPLVYEGDNERFTKVAILNNETICIDLKSSLPPI